MKVLVNASNEGKPMGRGVFDGIRALGARGIRTDIYTDAPHLQLREFVDYQDLQLLLIIMGDKVPGTPDDLVKRAREVADLAKQLDMDKLPLPPMFELANEPDAPKKYVPTIWRKKPELFGAKVAETARAIWGILGQSTLVISGGVTTPSKDSQDYLRKAAKYFPRGEGKFALGFHHYAPGMGDPDKPHKGFKTVKDQMQALKAIGFDLFDTESGGHTAPPEKHNDDEIARWLGRRLDINKEHGVLGSVVYQWLDGPSPSYFNDRFGLMTMDGTPKKSAEALRSWLSGGAPA